MATVDDREFYELMQLYRHAPGECPEVTVTAYERVKDWIRANYAERPSLKGYHDSPPDAHS